MAFLQKKLNKTDTTEKLTVLSEWLGNIFPYPARGQDKVQFGVSLISLSDKFVSALVVNSLYRLLKKPVLQSKEWLKFVRETGVKMGGTIHIRKLNDGQIQVVIEYDFDKRITRT